MVGGVARRGQHHAPHVLDGEVGGVVRRGDDAPAQGDEPVGRGVVGEHLPRLGVHGAPAEVVALEAHHRAGRRCGRGRGRGHPTQVGLVGHHRAADPRPVGVGQHERVEPGAPGHRARARHPVLAGRPHPDRLQGTVDGGTRDRRLLRSGADRGQDGGSQQRRQQQVRGGLHQCAHAPSSARLRVGGSTDARLEVFSRRPGAASHERRRCECSGDVSVVSDVDGPGVVRVVGPSSGSCAPASHRRHGGPPCRACPTCRACRGRGACRSWIPCRCGRGRPRRA